jgi:hypothetical protein
LLLSLAPSVAAPAPFPKPARPKEPPTLAQLERQLRERGIRIIDVNRVGPNTWVVTFPDSRAGCLVGRPPTRSLRFEAPDLVNAMNAFLQWWRERDERRLRQLRAVGAIP